ncbi:MAG: helix-turn-helix transcriptional regulator [Bacillota bacterium]
MWTLYESIISLCDNRNIKGGKMCVDLGLSKSLLTDLKSGRKKGITADTATKIANYFDVSVDRVLNGPDTEKAPTLTAKDERDVALNVERMMDDLEHSGDLMFDGVPMSEEAKAAMAAAMRVGLEEAKRRNKATYTPKKYRRE